MTTGEQVDRDEEATSVEEAVAEGADDWSGRSFLFGDLLALARARWIREMARAVAERGYPDYRATDAYVVRILRRRGAVAINGIGTRLGITRQAARKLVNGLERRGYATTVRDEHDSRVVRVLLTEEGQAYADAVIDVIHALNGRFSELVGPDDLAATARVLRAVLGGAAHRGDHDKVERSDH